MGLSLLTPMCQKEYQPTRKDTKLLNQLSSWKGAKSSTCQVFLGHPNPPEPGEINGVSSADPNSKALIYK